MKLSLWCKKQGLSYQTGWNLFSSGKLPNSKQLPSGTILVDDEIKFTPKEEYNAVYARVSSAEQRKTNLEYQVKRISSFIEAKGKTTNLIVKEVGSGLNDKRKELHKLLKNDKVTHIYVEHYDRLSRFGVEFIKEICRLRKIELVVINESENDEQDLMKDFVSLVTSFCARLYGLRRSKRKTEKLIENLKNEK